MKMNILKNIAKAFFVTLLVIMIAPGCKKSASLDGDPLVRDTLFTFTPSHGYPGSTVIIKGSGLNDVTAVSFGVKAGTIVSKSDAEISVTIPVGAVTAKVSLAKPSTVLTSFTNFVIDATPIPTITKFTPAIAGSGDTVTLTGNLLDKADSVFIGTLKATVLAGKTATSMKIICPLGMTTNKINMYYDYMTSYGMKKVAISASDNPLTLALASITSYDANIGALNVGQVLVIKGKMLSEIIASGVTFVNRVAGYTASDTIKTATFVASGDTMLSVTVPAGATYGVIKLKMLDGTITGGAYAVNLPAITSFSPLKSASQVAPRLFSVIGTKFDLVTSVKVGNTIATIDAGASSSTLLVFSAPGNIGGFVSLISANGTVTSSKPFILPGDAWVTDFDNTFSPVRFGPNSFNAVANENNVTLTDANSISGNYRKYSGTNNGSGNLAKIYLRGENGTTFNLYTTDPTGVYLDFDISYSTIPANFIETDGSVLVHLFLFSRSQNPYGFSVNVNVKFTGAENWQHVHVALSSFKEDSGGSGLEDGVVGTGTKKVNPDDLRIIAIGFPKSKTGVTGDAMTINIDNVKFIIQ